VAEVANLGMGGAVRVLGAGLFSSGEVADLPFPFPSPLFPLASLFRGHQCCFLALHEVNLRPHYWHCRCVWPSAASLAAFWHSHLNARFLLRANHFFSF
jgi:hypothetical protein